MCIFIFLLDSIRMSLPNPIRQHRSQPSGFPSLSGKLTISQMSMLKASDLSLIPHLYTHITSSYVYSYQSCPLCFCFSPPFHGSLNSMHYIQQIGAPMMCQEPYTVQAAMKHPRKKILPSHKVLQVKQWERHVNTSLPSDVIEAIGATHKSQSRTEEGVVIPSDQE